MESTGLKRSFLSIPVTDLTAQYDTIEEEINAGIRAVMQKGQFIMGPEVSALETEIAAYCGTEYAVGVASGTDALRLALQACNVGPGDEVITSPFSFVATSEAIVQCGAVPVFVDIDPGTCNIDVELIEDRITPRTRAILPVHLYGQPADMDHIVHQARRYRLRIIEDCAQAMGAEYRGQRVGSFGDAGCLSFFPSKNLGAFGDGGMVVTDNPKIAESVRILRKHGAAGNNRYILPGYNSRLDTLQAAVLLVKLKRLDSWIHDRRERANLYNHLFDAIPGIIPAYGCKYGKHSYNYYTIHVETSTVSRDELKTHLETRGIQTSVYYPLALHLQEAYHYLGYEEGDFPVAEAAQTRVLSLPMYPELTDEQVKFVVNGIREFVASRVSGIVV
jgi:dTDP-4-amino-4,6-dideoxygalactose transaminase